MNPEEKAEKIIIRHKNINFGVQRWIQDALDARSTRLGGLGFAGLLASGVISSAALIDESLKQASADKPVALLPASVAGAAGLAATYVAKSREVDRATRLVQAAAVKAGFLDINNQHPTAERFSTHAILINRRGDLVLLPRTTFQKLLLRIQQTALRRILPGRQRLSAITPTHEQTSLPPQAKQDADRMAAKARKSWLQRASQRPASAVQAAAYAKDLDDILREAMVRAHHAGIVSGGGRRKKQVHFSQSPGEERRSGRFAKQLADDLLLYHGLNARPGSSGARPLKAGQVRKVIRAAFLHGFNQSKGELPVREEPFEEAWRQQMRESHSA